MASVGVTRGVQRLPRARGAEPTKVQNFLDAAAAKAPELAIHAEAEARKKENEELKARLAQLESILAAQNEAKNEAPARSRK